MFDATVHAPYVPQTESTVIPIFGIREVTFVFVVTLSIRRKQKFLRLPLWVRLRLKSVGWWKHGNNWLHGRTYRQSKTKTRAGLFVISIDVPLSVYIAHSVLFVNVSYVI